MQDIPRLKFPADSLLAAMLGEHAPMDVRRAARRLRAESAPALAIDDVIADLAHGLGASEVSRSPAVLDALPPLFWLETRREEGSDAGAVNGWIVEKKRDGLAVRGFAAASPEAAPEPEGATTVSFDLHASEEDEQTRYVRGLIAAIALPDLLSQMGESSPVALIPADMPDGDASVLRGFKLSVALSPDSMPT